MPNLSFFVENAKAVTHAASPELALALSIRNDDALEEIQSVLLTAQVWIEAKERIYDADESARLMDLFGAKERWGTTLRRMMWTKTSVVVPTFRSHTTVDLPLPCPYDFEAAATKYLFSVRNGAIPLTLQFSGSAFFRDSEALLQIAPIPWSSEVRFQLAPAIYRETIDHYYPNRASLAIHRDTFDRLCRYKTASHAATWDEALLALLPREEKS